ncbi:plasmid stabilization protein [Oleiphilus sp. HI0125]|uniref:type II toxin-antitoxin system RelE/ParE family toxin n=1 Tax=Oleiphilus sp. HI0125 TaxID=1822266 RepID=UPI0007C22F83|nr:type II toxin-antitoxin system RelE/ParE family toxin [Oleiphilus sp. HI0125]KZZ60124.1 plasmid stabilization protein [Oleiphilus sp. HI0125]
MFTYKLSLNAKDDLKRIYEYGYSEFGEALADEYFFGFFSIFERIAENPYQYQTVDQIRQGYRRCPYRADTIYFRVVEDVVEIMAVLGGQELDVWL